MNVLVIGGAGYIGSHTVVELVSSGYKPIILDDFSNSNQSVISQLEKLCSQKLTFYKSDYKDVTKLKKILETENIEAIIHFAAYKAVGESVKQPLKYYTNNVSGFISLLSVMSELKLNKLVLSSSAAVYGIPSTDKVSEDSECHPISPYGWSKYFDEQILKDECSSRNDLKATALRYFNVVGAHETAQIGELPKGRPQNLLPIITQATAGKIPPFTVYGTDYDTPDGSCLRDYVHVVDLAKAHVMALKNTSNYQVYNIGTGKPTSVLQIIKTFEEVNKVKVPYVLGERRAGDPAAYFANVDRVQNNLGWKATKTTSDAVKDAWRWQQTLS